MATVNPRELARDLASRVQSVVESIEEGVNATVTEDEGNEEIKAKASQIAAAMVAAAVICKFRLTPNQVSTFVQLFIARELGEETDSRAALVRALLTAESD